MEPLAMKVLKQVEPGQNTKEKIDLGFSREMEMALNAAHDRLLKAFDDYRELADAQQKTVEGLSVSAVLLTDASVATGETMTMGKRVGYRCIPIHSSRDLHVTETPAAVISFEVAVKGLPDLKSLLDDSIKESIKAAAAKN